MSVCLSICLSVPSVPSRPSKITAETENFAKQSCQIYFKGDKKTFSHAAVLGEAKPSYVYSILKPHFRVSSPPQNGSQAVVCVSTPRMYPRSGYFPVSHCFYDLRSLSFLNLDFSCFLFTKTTFYLNILFSFFSQICIFL